MASKPDHLSTGAPGDLADLSIALIGGLAIAIVILFLCVVPFSGNIAGSRDFIAYWATGQQLIHHQNPYDWAAMATLQHAAGLNSGAVLIMRNPPWALPLAWPLGFLGLRLAAMLWSLLLAACLVLSVLLVRRMNGSPPGSIHWLGLAFTPALLCVTMGQTSLFALLGLVLFLRYHAQRPFAAGLALWLCMLKPHLLLPFAAALFLWIVASRAGRVLAGAVVALALSSAAAYLIDPRAWPDYFVMMRSPGVASYFIPCIADVLRLWLWPQHHWTQYLPSALACIWAFAYFWTRRQTWDWARNAGPLLLVGLLAAPLCRFYDQCLAIPALIDAAYGTRSRKLLAVLALMVLLADLELCFVKVISPWFLWTAPAWLAWYLLACLLSLPVTPSKGLRTRTSTLKESSYSGTPVAVEGKKPAGSLL